NTVLTIADQLRSIIHYDKFRVMVLDEERIVEVDRPKNRSQLPVHAMCKATRSDEFATLRSMEGI
ncbi:hypothetical protein B0H17DRAFT_951224, partial [Mycena rosella]